MSWEISVTRTPMWLARGAILVCFVMLILLMTVGFGEVTSTQDGNATVYTASAIGSLYFGVMGILTCLLAVVFWLQRGWFFTCISVVLIALAIFIFINVPSGINHCVIVTPDSFYHRVGSWYSPVEYQIEFANVAYLQVAETRPSRNKRKNYELQCFMKPDGEKIAVPIFDMMKKALPEIVRRAAAREIVIGENENGWQIPPDLSG